MNDDVTEDYNATLCDCLDPGAWVHRVHEASVQVVEGFGMRVLEVSERISVCGLDARMHDVVVTDRAVDCPLCLLILNDPELARMGELVGV